MTAYIQARLQEEVVTCMKFSLIINYRNEKWIEDSYPGFAGGFYINRSKRFLRGEA
jgi:hypothetical protein